MRVVSITAGAAGMFCGSCMKDNALAAALNKLGHDATLVPTYTPIRTDELDVSEGRVFYGGIAVYLEDKSWLFRHTPPVVDWLLNRPWLLRLVSKKAQTVNYADMAGLTVSMLQGRDGKQRKELRKLTDWLKAEMRPDAVILTNVLLSGLVPAIRQELGVPVLSTLQGDDIFLDALRPADRERCVALIRQNDSATTAYLVTSADYADRMAEYLGLPRAKMHVVLPGINLTGFAPAEPEDRPPTVGYFARICPEKGFHHAVDAYLELRKTTFARFRYAGWLGETNQAFLAREVAKLAAAGYAADVERVDCPDHASKAAFFRSVDVLTVPTTYKEPKGLYVLEAWASGVPVVLPAHGAFPELVAATGAGLLVPPGDPAALASGLRELLADPARRRDMGRRGRRAVEADFTAEGMARRTVAVLEKYVRPAG